MNWPFRKQNFERNCPVCMGCKAFRATNGACDADGVSHISHANANYCPQWKFAGKEPKPDAWDNLPKQPPPVCRLTLAKLTEGAVARVQGKLNMAAAPAWTALRRLAICASCPESVKDGPKPKTCRSCGCNLPAKISLANKSCPQGRWGKVNEAVAFVQPARNGDILSILPAMRRFAMEGHKVYHVVKREYVSLVEGLSYLEPVPFEGAADAVADGIKVAEAIGAEPVPSQRWGNPNPIRSDNYQSEPWQRAGMPDRFDREPLILDNRNAEAEARLCRLFIGEDRRPLLLVNLQGNSVCASSPFPFPDMVLADRQKAQQDYLDWIWRTWGERCNVVNLARIHAERFQDLLGLYERAAAVLSVDTATVHLSYASGTPTVGLVNDIPAKASLRRPHWIERLTYSESQTDAGKERITAAIDAELAKPRVPHVIHVVDDSWRPPADCEDFRRLSRAAATWVGRRAWTTARLRHPKRTSTSIGDNRSMPFLRDLFDWGCELAGPDDLVCFTNSDISLTPEAPDVIRAALANAPCCYGPRAIVPTEIARTEPRFIREQLKDFKRDELPRHDDGGTDLFAFRPEWWKKRRDEFPDLILGCARWDIVMVHLMLADNPNAGIRPPIIWHEAHVPFWGEAKNINSNPGQLHNKRLAQAWLKERGIPAGD